VEKTVRLAEVVAHIEAYNRNVRRDIDQFHPDPFRE
jgi:hypothetical protein